MHHEGVILDQWGIKGANKVEIEGYSKLPSKQCCAKLVGFEANIGFEIEISQKYRYRIGIGYEIARIWTSILILFRNFELIDIGFDIGFELLHVGFQH